MFKRVMVLMLILCSMLLFFSAEAAVTDYEFNRSTGTITKYKGSETYVEVPSTINYTIVRAIGSRAFSGNNLYSVEIPDSVMSIGDSAFNGCKYLTEVDIRGGVTEIGNSAFASCKSLKKVVLPATLVTIKDWAFSGCTSLDSISLPERMRSIGYRAFGGCTSLRSITIPRSVNSIGEGAFISCPVITIYAYSGSEASRYASQNKIRITNIFDVSGNIEDMSGNWLEGIDVSYSGTTVKTDSWGDFTLKGIELGGYITPSKAGYLFRPANIYFGSSSFGNLQFTATYSVEGYVRGSNGSPIYNLLVYAGSLSSMTDYQGHYSISGLSGINDIAPKASGYNFIPAKAQIDSPSTNVNFSATYDISGKVLGYDNKPISGVITSAGGKKAITDQNGSYRIEGISGDLTLDVTASRAGYTFTPNSINVKGPTTLADFKGGYTVEGKIVDGQGRGIVDVTVSTIDKSAKTDSIGKYQITGLNGAVSLIADKPGYTFRPNSIAVSGPVTDADFVSGYNVSGKVTDLSGKALPGVRVITGDKSTVTDSQGRYSFNSLPSMQAIKPSMDGFTFMPASILATSDMTGADFKGFYSISGKVTDIEGKGVSGAKVFSGQKEAVTNSEGIYFLTFLNDTSSISVNLDGYTFIPSSKNVSGPSSGVDFKANGQVAGRIVDKNGEGIENVLVKAGATSALTLYDGTYVIDGVNGPVKVEASKAGYSFEPNSKQTVGGSRNVDFVASYRISGKIMDAKGNGILGVKISAGGSETVTEADGSFEISGLSSSTRAIPYKQGYSFTPSFVDVHGPFEEIAFGALFAVSGKVVDHNGTAMPDIKVLANGRNDITRSDGSFEITGLSGEVVVSASKAGFQFNPIEVRASGPTDQIRFSVGNLVKGSIIDSSGIAIGGATLKAGLRTYPVGLDGNFEILGLVVGTEIVVAKDGYEFSPSKAIVTSASEVVQFIGTFSVKGKVHDEAGRGLGGASIKAGDQSLVTADDGSFSFKGLSVGTIIKPSKSSFSFIPQEREIFGPEGNLDFLARYSIAGRIYDNDGRGVPGVVITTKGASAESLQDGSYSLEDISGELIITPYKEGYSFRPSQLTSAFPMSDVDFLAVYSVSGMVLDAQGTPIEGAELTSDQQKVLSDKSGKFTFEGLSGKERITVNKQGYTFEPSYIEPSTPTSNVKFTGRYGLFGRVEEAEGVPIQGVIIKTGSSSAVTDSFGIYSLMGLSGDASLNIDAYKEGYSFQKLAGTSSWNEINFRGLYSVTGKVTDSLGRPIAGVRVYSESSSTLTNADGTYLLTGLKGDSYIRAFHEGSTFAPEFIRTKLPIENANFSSGYSVTGRIVDEKNNPIPDVLVWEDKEEIRTGPDGSFKISGLHGANIIRPSLEGYSFTPDFVGCKAEATGVDFACSYSVEGRITDASGSGLKGVVITTGDTEAVTASDGSYTLFSLSGRVRITPELAGYRFVDPFMSVAGPVKNADFRAIGQVCGRIIDEAGNGIEGVKVTAGSKSAISSVSGEYCVDGTIGRMVLSADKQGYEFKPIGGNPVVLGSAVNMDFSGTFSISGKVVELGGRPVQDAIVAVGSHISKTTSKGTFEIGGLSLKQGQFLTITKEGYSFNPEQVEVLRPRTDLEFSASYSIYGRVMDPKGNGMSGIRILGGTASAVSGMNGDYVLRGLSGEVEVLIEDNSRVYMPKKALVESPGTGLDFVSGYNIRGFILDPLTQEGLSGVEIQAGNLKSTSDEEGKFELRGIFENAMLQASLDGYRFEPASVAIDGDAMNVRLNTSYSVSGTVVDGGGKGIEGVRLTVGSKMTITEADGSFALMGIMGKTTIEPYKEGQVFIPSSYGVTGPIEGLKILAASKISGKVVDRLNNPIPDVAIKALDAAVISDERGNYVIDGLIGDPKPVAIKEGYVFEKVTRSASLLDMRVDFLGSYEISGSIVNPEGNPLAGVSISINDMKNSVVTGVDGLFRLVGLSGENVLTASKEGYSFLPSSQIVSVPGRAYSMLAYYSSKGKVVDLAGKGIEGVTVEAEGKAVKTDSNGAFIIDNISKDTEVKANKAGWSFNPSAWRSTTPGSITVTGTYSISGSLTKAGAPISNHQINVYPGQMKLLTDNAGKFTIEGLSGVVIIEPEGKKLTFSPSRVNLDAPSDPIDFKASFEVGGYVTELLGRSGIEGVQLFAGMISTRTEKDGSFVIAGLEEGTEIVPILNGYDFQPASRYVTEQGRVDFVATYQIIGKVEDEQSKGIKDAVVRIGNKEITTDANGVFKATGLSDRTSVSVVKEGYTFSPVENVVVGPELDMSFKAGYSVSGRVTNGYNMGIKDVEVSAGGKSVLTDNNGRFAITNLSGEIQVAAKKEGYSFIALKETRLSQPGSVEFKGYFSVRGVVENGKQEGIEGVSITTADVEVITNKNGVYVIDKVSINTQILPFKKGYSFKPEYHRVTEPGEEVKFIAEYEISGKVVDIFGMPLPGVDVVVGGNKAQTDSNGKYLLYGLSGENEVVFYKQDHTFNPKSVKLSGPAVVQDVEGNGPPPGAVMRTGSIIEIDQITKDGNPKRDLRMSPDGNLLAYSAFQTSSEGYGKLWAVYTRNPDATGNNSISSQSAQYNNVQPAWFPDSQRIMFVNYQNGIPELVWKEKSSNSLTWLMPGGNDQSPDIDRSGQRVVFQKRVAGKDAIFTVDVKGVYLKDTELKGTNPRWHPTEDIIVYSEKKGNYYQIYKANLGGFPTSVTNDIKGDCIQPCWSPDGKWICFISNKDGMYHLYVIRADGTLLTQLTSGKAEAFYPEWAPDGRIYFVSDASSNQPKVKNPLEWTYSEIFRCTPQLPKIDDK